ncbi:MAG: GNAT family N-acetyltransferase, partial [Anaerolineae bacterium]|nr:GNAT family N-acetyltransferase [Anaerolineae bacterium]
LMLETSPPESSHALRIDGLKRPEVTVWEMRQGEMLVGCGALKALSDGKSGEIKSMHTVAQLRGG